MIKPIGFFLLITNQVVLFQIIQPCRPCIADLFGSASIQFVCGYFIKSVCKHPVSGSRVINCIANIEKYDGFIR